MAKKFYIQFNNENNLYKYPYITGDDAITLEEFRDIILKKDFIKVENKSGLENIPNGWRRVPTIKLVETSSIISFFEDENYQRDIDKKTKRDEAHRVAIEEFNTLYGKLKGLKLKWYSFIYNATNPYIKGKTPLEKIKQMNVKFIENECDKIRKMSK